MASRARTSDALFFTVINPGTYAKVGNSDNGWLQEAISAMFVENAKGTAKVPA
jgi:hypothetical protein